MISDERLQKALTYLAETDELAAKAKALVASLEAKKKTVVALAFSAAAGKGGIGEREHLAHASQEYLDWTEDYENAVVEYETFRNKRRTEESIVEVWRSMNANRRVGNV